MDIIGDIPYAVVTDSTIKPWTAGAPQPFTTSALQQAASSLYKMSPKTTMSTAQKLYEGGYITYMRTDSTTLSEDAVKEIDRLQKEITERVETVEVPRKLTLYQRAGVWWLTISLGALLAVAVYFLMKLKKLPFIR